jgi:hypothetical protein
MGWVVNATPRPLYPRKRPGTHCIGDWVGLRDGLDRIRSPDRPARSESLYRLSYSGPPLERVWRRIAIPTWAQHWSDRAVTAVCGARNLRYQDICIYLYLQSLWEILSVSGIACKLPNNTNRNNNEVSENEIRISLHILGRPPFRPLFHVWSIMHMAYFREIIFCQTARPIYAKRVKKDEFALWSLIIKFDFRSNLRWIRHVACMPELEYIEVAVFRVITGSVEGERFGGTYFPS